MTDHTYRVAERFKSVQGEGLYTGTPMAFIRFVGCSVGKKVCAACDTMFEQEYPWQNGGVFTAEQLFEWARPFAHICLTGGEPFDQDLTSLIAAHPGWGRTDASADFPRLHVETSGTKPIPVGLRRRAYICVSPKPGYLPEMIDAADEIKVIVPGLGPGDGWPGLADALTWARAGKMVFVQPRNLRSEIDKNNLQTVLAVLQEHPELRLSCQLHKFLHVS